MSTPRTIPTSQIPDVVTYSILINGSEIPVAIPVTQISIHKEVNKIPLAKIKISDGDPAAEDFQISNETYFVPGNEIEIKMGYRSDHTSMFKGIIITHSNKISNNGAELNIECKDKAVKLTIGKKSKHFEDKTNSEIVEEIIDTYGLEKDIDAGSAGQKDVIQFHTTDWDFILSRIDMSGKICLIEDGKIIIKSPELTASSVLDLLFGATIMEYNAEIDARTQYNEVTATSWDYSSQAIAEETGEAPSMAAIGNLSNADLADVIGLENYRLIHSGKLDQQVLKAWADAKMLKSSLSKMKGNVKFQGFPSIKAGDTISLNGIGERFNGPVFVSSVKHEYSGNWTTEVHFGFSAEWFAEQINPYHLSAQSGLMPGVQGLQIGIVTDLEDPEGEHRVKVKLPVVSNDEEGVWMRIATLDAGNNRGTFFHPEIDDEVIVGFIFNDANQPIILGMLNSSALPAPLTAANDNHEKGYVSRSGIKMIFNDDEKSFKLETPAGKKITVDEDSGVIQLEDENGNILTMESSGVTVESASDLTIKAAADITIEAVNINLTASSSFSVSASGSEIKAGPGSVEVKSTSVKVDGSGMTEIKGGMVKIN